MVMANRVRSTKHGTRSQKAAGVPAPTTVLRERMSRSMSTQTPRGQKSDRTTPRIETYRVLKNGDRHQYIGVDEEDYHHHVDRQTGLVHRIDTTTGERERVTDITTIDEPAADAFEVYVHCHVGDRVGWTGRVLFTTWDIWGRPERYQ